MALYLKQFRSLYSEACDVLYSLIDAVDDWVLFSLQPRAAEESHMHPLCEPDWQLMLVMNHCALQLQDETARGTTGARAISDMPLTLAPPSGATETEPIPLNKCIL